MNQAGTILTIGLMLFVLNSSGQVSINGKVVDQKEGLPIAYVNVWITGYPYGSSTNIEGEFEIKIPTWMDNRSPTISFSCIGYYSRKIPLTEFSGIPSLVIQLNKSVTNLSELVIQTEKVKRKNAANARKLVQKALNLIPRNYPKKPFLLNTFYRHYCSENSNYVRLIEAAVDAYSPKQSFKFEPVPDDHLAFRITQLRRSFDFTENAKLFHPPISLNYLWSNDLTDFGYHNPLSGNLDQFNFKIIDTTNFDRETVYVVQFVQVENDRFSTQSQFSGKLFILKNQLAFLRTEVTETKEKIGVLDSIRSVIHKKTVYRLFAGRYYLDRLTNDVDALYTTMDSSKVIVDTLRHRSHIEMISNNILVQQPIAFEGKEPERMDLRKIRYDSTFWSNYTVLKATTLENKIIVDLSEKISLQQQFESFNTIESGGISIVESTHFKELLANHTGVPLYVVLWSNWGQLNYLDLQPINYFKRMLRKERLKLLLVAVEHDQQNWVNNRNYYGLNKRYLEHERLDLGFDSHVAKSYFNNVFPYFMSVNSNGQIISGEPPLPNNEDLKPYLKALIRNNPVVEQ